MGRHEKPHNPEDEQDGPDEGAAKADQHHESRGKHAAPPKGKKK